MTTTVKSLQDLYVAMGGTLADVADITTIPDMIEALKTVATGGGGASLPNVTDADNGDVLTVVEGEWSKAELPTPEPELPAVTSEDIGDVLTVVSDGESGAEWGKQALVIPQNIAVFTGSITGNYPNERLAFNNGVKLSDITAAVTSGKYVVILTESTTFLLDQITGADSATFESFYEENNLIRFYDFTDVFTTSQSDTNVKVNRRDSAFLPMVSTTDNDKILKVVNGVWTAVSPA